jgi:F420-non-reducing hydrogenase iron-sulfur subunit
MPGVDRPDAPARPAPTPDDKPAATAQPGRPPRIVGFLCDFAVDVSTLAGPDGTLRDLPNVKLIRVPCSGFVRPSWLEFALRNGAEGTFVCGCPLGDCFNRLGNNLIGDRVVQLRRRFERQRIHPDRIAAIYFGLHDHDGFLAAVRAFSDRVGTLPGPVVPAPRAAAARPAGTPAARPAAAGAGPGATPGAAAPPSALPGGSPGAAADGAAPREER